MMHNKQDIVGKWHQWPEEHAQLRSGVYQGKLYQKGATQASKKAVDDTLNLLEDELATVDVRHAWQHIKPEVFFESIGRIRKQLFMNKAHRRNVLEVIEAMGLDSDLVAFEPFRLRVIQHLGHQNPLAAPVYYPHRDTWYAHPQCLMVGWIPLDDLSCDETFEIYPDWWNKPVPNDSEIFDYSQWVRDGWQLKIGWQHKRSGTTARYPGTTEPVEFGQSVGFDCKAADNIVFSGGHFHKSLEQATGKSRFSLDFRMVHLADIDDRRGAPNVDSRSKGCAVVDYLHPPHCTQRSEQR